MKYKNIITNRLTKYPYRFKTRREFQDEYGYYWYEDIECSWFDDDVIGMNYLFGQDLETENKKYLDEILYEDAIFPLSSLGIDLNRDNDWSISKDMITKNGKSNFGDIYLRNKENIYENNIIKYNDYEKGDY